MLLSHSVIFTFGVGEGEEVYMVGRFIHHAGRYFNQPSVRSGIIRLMPSMIELDDGQTQEAFLIEMRSISGHSGSPVMWIYPPYHPQADLHNVTSMDMKHTFDGPWLLGIDCGSFPYYQPVYKVRKEQGEIVRTRLPDLEAKSHAGVAAEIPAWKLQELLNLEEFVKARKEEDENLARKKDGGGFH
jgi:hypothetical protein